MTASGESGKAPGREAGDAAVAPPDRYFEAHDDALEEAVRRQARRAAAPIVTDIARCFDDRWRVRSEFADVYVERLLE